MKHPLIRVHGILVLIFYDSFSHPNVAFAPQVEEMTNTNGLAQFHFSFAADASNRVPEF